MNKTLRDQYIMINETPAEPMYLLGIDKKIKAFYNQESIRYGEIQATKNLINVLKNSLPEESIEIMLNRNYWI